MQRRLRAKLDKETDLKESRFVSLWGKRLFRMIWNWWIKQFGPDDEYGPPEPNARGVILRVGEVIQRDFTRTQVKAIPEILGDDKSLGEFQTLQFLPPMIGLRVATGPIPLYRTVLRLADGEPVYLVVRGRKWQVGDPIPMDKIAYRYEP